MKIERIVMAVLIIFIAFMSTVFVYGFVQKQLKENISTSKPNTNQDSATNTNSTTTQSTTNESNQKTFTTSEVSKHNKMSDCWIIIDKNVYDVGSFLDEHPGGADLIVPFCGKDATQAFATKGGKNKTHSQAALQLLSGFFIGIVK